jgi:hypothetical protein
MSNKLQFPISHPSGASEKMLQLTRIRVKGGIRVEYTIRTIETDIMKKGRKVALLKKEKLLGFQPKEIWAAYSISGKRMGFADLHKLKDLLKQIAKRI